MSHESLTNEGARECLYKRFESTDKYAKFFTVPAANDD